MKETISTNTQEQPYSLHNQENFKNRILSSSTEIVNKYVSLLTEYLKFAFEKIDSIKNKNYLNFIIIRGIETITNVFNNLLYFTKNLGVSFFHSQKSYYFYIEFIGQITETQNTFLQLSSRDATLYVYKKTLYELHNDLKKNVTQTKEDTEKLETLHKNSLLFKNIVNYLINNKDFSVTYSLDDKIKYIEKYEKICNQINKMIHNINTNINTNKNNDNINTIYNFIDNINKNSKIPIEKYLNILELYFKKIGKNENLINNTYMTKKLIDLNFENKLETCNATEFVNYLCEKENEYHEPDGSNNLILF